MEELHALILSQHDCSNKCVYGIIETAFFDRVGNVVVSARLCT